MKVIYRRPLKNRMSIKQLSRNVSMKRLNEMIAKGYEIISIDDVIVTEN